jgi:nucleotide-binding universal stress UspA family protein
MISSDTMHCFSFHLEISNCFTRRSPQCKKDPPKKHGFNQIPRLSQKTFKMSTFPDDFPVETKIIASHSPLNRKIFKRTILVPVENASQTALEYVLNNILKPDDRIVLVHVRESPVDEMLAWEAAIIPEEHLAELEVKMKQESKIILESLLKQALSQSQNIFVDCVSIRGDARHELITLIEEMKPDLVVMNSRGMGLIKSMIVGSVSLHLLHHSSVPVMILKDQDLAAHQPAK